MKHGFVNAMSTKPSDPFIRVPESLPTMVAAGGAALTRLGLKTVSGIAPVISTEYDDVIRAMYW